MQILRTFLVPALAAVAALQGSRTPTRSDPVLVTAVFDGATINIAAVGRVRLLGIEAPKRGHALDATAPFARDAKTRLTALVLHRWIRLEWDGPPTDNYNRHRAYVLTEDGQFINAILLREGLARFSAGPSVSRLDELRRAEAEAQSFRRGLWGPTSDLTATEYTHEPSTRSSARVRVRKPRGATTSKKKDGQNP
jgi:micrococcal nuclease